MNLSDMADYVCSKINQTETEDVAACKTFLRRRYESIWNDQLWKDSIVQISSSFDPDNSDNAVGILVLPEIIDHPIAIRGDARAVLVNPIERYYRLDLDYFARTGAAFEMALLSPAWLTVRPEDDPFDRTSVTGLTTGGNFRVSHANPIPSSQNYHRYPTTAGQWYEIINGAQSTFYILADPGDGFFYLDDEVAIAANETVIVQADSDNIAMLGTATDIVVSLIVLKTNESSGAGATVTIVSSSVSDTANIKVTWRDQTGKRYETTGAMPIILTPDDDAGHFEIESIFKSATAGTITVTLMDGDGPTSILGTLAPTATRTPSFQRVRIFDMPGDVATLRVAGKVKCDTLDFDNQEPGLRGCENVLLAFAQGDMLERERRYGQAQACYGEAMALLEQLKRVEVVQQAHNVRIVPEFGFVSEWEFNQPQLLSF